MNTTSVGSNVQLYNSGNATMSVSGITIAGTNAGDFAQTNSCGSSFASGTGCTIAVAFTPTALGSRSALLSVTDNASGSPHTVSLTGTGSQPAVNISPTTLTFGQQIQYTQSASQTVTLSNVSGAPVTFSYFNTDGPDYGDFGIGTNTCGNSLAAGANCTVGVYFRPNLTGPRSASFLVELNGSTTQQTVSLSGTGVLPATPPGAYTVTVQASSDGDIHSLNIPVTVQ